MEGERNTGAEGEMRDEEVERGNKGREETKNNKRRRIR